MPLPPPLLLPHPSSARKSRVRHRTALLALLALSVFTCYLLFIAYPSLRLSRQLLTHVHDHDPPQPFPAPAPTHSLFQLAPPARKPASHRFRPVHPARPPLALSEAQELAALSAFIAALPHNVLPPSVDPYTPLDPQLVLDFDPRSESARDELDRLIDQTWSRFPVILFTKLHSADSREVRHMLDSMHLDPTPFVVETDQREDARVLLPLLARLTHVPTLPILLIGGQAVGIDAPDAKGLMADIRTLHESGELTRRVVEAGATVEPRKKKGKGK